MIYVFFGPGGIRIPSDVFTFAGQKKHEKAQPPRYIPTKKKEYTNVATTTSTAVMRSRVYIYSIIIWCGEGETVRQTAAVVVGFVTNGEPRERNGEKDSRRKYANKVFVKWISVAVV